MSEKWVQHLGDDQLVGGMPKHMVGVAGGGNKKGSSGSSVLLTN